MPAGEPNASATGTLYAVEGRRLFAKGYDLDLVAQRAGYWGAGTGEESSDRRVLGERLKLVAGVPLNAAKPVEVNNAGAKHLNRHLVRAVWSTGMIYVCCIQMWSCWNSSTFRMAHLTRTRLWWGSTRWATATTPTRGMYYFTHCPSTEPTPKHVPDASKSPSLPCSKTPSSSAQESRRVPGMGA